MPKNSKRKRANVQSLDLSNFERVAIKALLKAFVKIEYRAIDEEADFVLVSSDLDEIKRVLVDMQVAAFAQSSVRIREQVPALSLDTKWPISAKAFRELNKSDISAIERNYGVETSKVLSKLSVELESGVRRAAEKAVSSGVPVKTAIKSYFSKSGLDESSYHKFSTIVRTQLQLSYASSAAKELAKPEIAAQHWGYEYVTVGDGRVRDSHAALDGTRLPKDDPFWRRFMPPNGWNCRCQAIPIFEEEKIVSPPDDVEPDKGFAFEPGNISLAPIATVDTKLDALPSTEFEKRLAKPGLTEARRVRIQKKLDKALAREAAQESKLAKKAAKSKPPAAKVKVKKAKVADSDKAAAKAERIKRREARLARKAERIKRREERLAGTSSTVSKTAKPNDTQSEVLKKHASAIENRKKEIDELVELKRIGRNNLSESQKQRLDELDDSSRFNNDKLNRAILDSISEQSRARENIEHDNDVTFKAYGPTGGPSNASGANAAAGWLNRHGNRDLLQTTLVPVEVSPISRAYTNGLKIVVNKLAEEHVFVHEWGHQYELHYFRVKDRVQKFSKKRRGKEPLTRISDRLSASEVSYKDDYFKAVAACSYDEGKDMLDIKASYVGKDYKGKASEIMSVGMELMHSNPSAFAAADPEWFDLVEGIMTGRYK